MNKQALKVWIFICTLANLPWSQPATAQLQVGDKIPEMVIENVINAPYDKIKLTDLKNQLIILHFFSINCSTCQKELSAFDELQQSMKGLKVIAITNHRGEKVKEMIKEKKWKLPFVNEGNEMLFDHFPYKLVSHVVWINNNRVIAITGGKSATPENLRKVIAGEKVNLPLKQDLLDYDDYKPLFIDGNGGNGENLRYQSVVTGEIKGIRGGFFRPKNMYKVMNRSVKAIFQTIFSEGTMDDFTNENWVILEMSDDKKAWISNASGDDVYSYSLYFPEVDSREQKALFAQNDLNNYFGTFWNIHAQVEQRQVECLVLMRANNGISLSTDGEESMFKKNENGKVIIQNRKMNTLVYVLTNQTNQLGYPFLDKSGFNGSLDMELPANFESLDSLRKTLRQYGLDLKKEKHTLSMLVIKEKSNE